MCAPLNCWVLHIFYKQEIDHKVREIKKCFTSHIYVGSKYPDMGKLLFFFVLDNLLVTLMSGQSIGQTLYL